MSGRRTDSTPDDRQAGSNKVVELNIVARASDNTIGRTLKKTFSDRICTNNG